MWALFVWSLFMVTTCGHYVCGHYACGYYVCVHYVICHYVCDHYVCGHYVCLSPRLEAMSIQYFIRIIDRLVTRRKTSLHIDWGFLELLRLEHNLAEG